MVVKFNRGGGLVPPPQLCPGFIQKFDKYPKKSHTAGYCDSKNCKMKEKKKQIFEHDFKTLPTKPMPVPRREYLVKSRVNKTGCVSLCLAFQVFQVLRHKFFIGYHLLIMLQNYIIKSNFLDRALPGMKNTLKSLKNADSQL